MDTPLTPRQRVYLSARTIFSGQNALVRKQKKVRELVEYYRNDLSTLLGEFGVERLVDIVKNLLEERIFESVLRARAEFPELFPPPQQEVEREATEQQAIEDTESSLEEIQLENEDITLTEDHILENATDSPVELLQAGSAVPTLYPSCIPYEAQHRLLTTAQKLLEECCFDFAKKWLPNIVQDNAWDCGAAVELTQWTSILTIEHASNIPSHAIDLVKSQSSLNELFLNTHKIRHTAVHRVPTTARGISKLLEYGVQLAEALRDLRCASKLEGLKVAVDNKVTAMELTKCFLESDTSTKLEALRRQKEDIERQEHELIERMVQEDQDNKALIGRLLMECIDDVLAPKPYPEESEVLHDTHPESDEPREHRIEAKATPPKRLINSLAIVLSYLPSRSWY